MSTSDQERDEQVDALLQSAREKRDDLQQAEAEIQQALGLNPGAAHVWFERGELYSAHEMLDKALACYEQARTMSQDNGDYEEAYTQAKAQLENQRTKLSELNLPKVIVAKGTDGLLPREDLETRILEEEDMPTDVIRVAPKVDDADESAPKERYAEGETVILEEAETGELETEPAGQPPEPTRAAPGDPDDPDDRLVTRALWKGAEALGKGAEALGKGINNVFGQPAQEPASDGEPEVKTKVISREALNEKLSDMLGSVDRQMLETLRETPGEIKDKLSRILATVDQDMLETVKETAKVTAKEVKSDLFQILKTIELGTKDLKVEKEELGPEEEPGASTDPEAAEPEAAEPEAVEPKEDRPRPRDKAALAITTRALLEVIDQGDASEVLDLCRGDTDTRPQIPKDELALVTVQALVTLGRQVLASVAGTEGAAGEALGAMRKRLGED